MKLQRHVFGTVLALSVLTVLAISLFPASIYAQGPPPAVGPVSWFDWSDFRAEVGFRVFLARLGSVNVTGVDLEALFSSDQYALTHDPEAFKEFWAALYIDRVALRYHHEDDRYFNAQVGPLPDGSLSRATLDISGQRLGIDVDIFRFPTFKVGINFDYHNQPIRFTARHWNDFRLGNRAGNYAAEYFDGDEPLTFGVHGRVIPFRIREVPVTVQGRFRFPITIIPLFKRDKDAQITEFEVSAGLRPNIWETSLYGHTTFSAAVNVGYRWDQLVLTGDKRVAPPAAGPATPTDARLNAMWQGAFLEAVFTY